MSTPWHPSPIPEDVIERERLALAGYALHSVQSQGRRYPEPAHAYRGPFQRDRDRITHCSAFRRLSGKMQVFTDNMGDYHRTRLTHTLEVASLARTLGRQLRLNEDLIEALALLHDLGHPPFGHTGEEVLHVCLAEHGGFSHNRHALRLVEVLERRWWSFPGLNLSYEVVASQASRIEKERAPLRPLLEGQVVDAADSVAYNTHDADDALVVGLLTMDELLELAMWRDAQVRVRREFADLRDDELRRAMVHHLVEWQLTDLLVATSTRLAIKAPRSPLGAQSLPLLVAPSKELAEQKRELEDYLFTHVYRHPRVVAVRQRAQAELYALFALLTEHPEHLPAPYQQPGEELALRVADYLAAQTDRAVQGLYERLCGKS